MDKKGQVFQNLQAIIIPLIAIAMVLVIGFLILSESKEKVIDIDTENNLLFVRGAVPGAKSGLLQITNTVAKLNERFTKAESEKLQDEKEEAAVAETAEENKDSGEVKNA